METVILRKVIKSGTALCVVIPVNILRSLNIKRGDELVFRVYENDTIVMRKIKPEEFAVLKPDQIDY